MPHPPAARVVLALDLSKTSTGYSVACQHPDGSIEYLATGAIKPPDAVRKSRWYFPITDFICARLEDVLRPYPWFAARQFSVAIEAPVLKSSQSEETYFIFQEVLRHISSWIVDVSWYSNAMIKNFALRFTARPRDSFPDRLDKADMENIWRTELRPQNESVFPSFLLATNDAVDAAWLNLLALYAQAHVLLLPGDPVPMQPLWSASSGDFFRARFQKVRLNRLIGFETPNLAPIYSQMTKNGHLSFGAVSFFPFRALDGLARHAERERERDPGSLAEHLLERIGKNITRKALKAALDHPRLSFALDSSGSLLLAPPS